VPLSSETLRCGTVVPSRHCWSSRAIGWTSLLLDLHTGASSYEPYASVATPDVRVGVSLHGRYSCDVVVGGRWRHDAHDPGTICVHRTGESTRYRFPEPETADYRTALIYLPVDLLAASADHLRRPGQPDATPFLNSIIDRDPAITQMAHALVRAMAVAEDDLYAGAAAAWLGLHVLSRYGPGARGEEESRRAGGITDARMARVIDFMAAHFAEPLTLDRIAAEACISKFHFTRLFRERVGQTPYRYLAELRLDAARHMLTRTDRAVSEVAAACGFVSPSHFSAAFTRRFGVAPSGLRGPRGPGGADA
jgi:AraC family transcriptional regulator